MTIKVVLADDNALFRAGMEGLLVQGSDVQAIGQAKDTPEAIRKTVVMRPDVVLMDLNMPGGGGIEATRRILVERPRQTICILTCSQQDSDLFSAVRVGTRGYLLKNVAVEDLHKALNILASGGSVLAPRLAARLLIAYCTLAARSRAGPSDLDKLTTRERQILELVSAGDSNREIGDRLSITENTVKVHMRNIQEKLHLRNRQQAAAFAAQEGIVPTHAVSA